MVATEPSNDNRNPQFAESSTNGSKITANTAPSYQPATLDKASDKPPAPLKTPFLDFSPSSKPPPSTPLTSDQQKKYSSILAAITSWATTPSSSSAKAPSTPLSDSECMWLTHECFLRYLRATKWSVPAATARILSTLSWRREFLLPTHDAEYMSPENATGKLVIMGWDVAARPCIYLAPALQNTTGNDKQVQHIVFGLERCIDLMGPGQDTLTMLINYKGALKTPKTGQGIQVLNILQTHYPERLGKALMINVPWIVWGFLKIISPFIDPNTREKIKYGEDLRQYVPADQLLKTYGGDVDFVYEHEAYWPALNELAARRREEQVERWVKGGKMIGEMEGYIRGGEQKCLREMEEEEGVGARMKGGLESVGR